MNAVRTARTIGFGPALGLLALACSGGSPGGAGTSAWPELPGCLRDLLAPCATEGACVSSAAPAGFGGFCFASGVRASATVADDARGCSNVLGVMTVNKPDGTPCYTYESYSDVTSTDCSVRQYAWKDPAGNVVATGTSSPVPGWDLSITCAATSETARCTGPTPDRYPPEGCCYLSQFGAAVCRAGVPVGAACTSGACP